MNKIKFEEMLMPPDLSFPKDEADLLADLTLAFIYGLSTGVFKPEYGKRLLRSLALRHFWFWRLIRKAFGRKELSPEEMGGKELANFEDIANHVEGELPLD